MLWSLLIIFDPRFPKQTTNSSYKQQDIIINEQGAAKDTISAKFFASISDALFLSHVSFFSS